MYGRENHMSSEPRVMRRTATRLKTMLKEVSKIEKKPENRSGERKLAYSDCSRFEDKKD